MLADDKHWFKRENRALFVRDKIPNDGKFYGYVLLLEFTPNECFIVDCLNEVKAFIYFKESSERMHERSMTMMTIRMMTMMENDQQKWEKRTHIFAINSDGKTELFSLTQPKHAYHWMYVCAHFIVKITKALCSWLTVGFCVCVFWSRCICVGKMEGHAFCARATHRIIIKVYALLKL